MQGLTDIQRRRVRRTLSEVKQKLEEALRLSNTRDQIPFAPFDASRKRLH